VWRRRPARRRGLVQGYPRSIVGKRDAILFEGRLDPPVGLIADLELLARRCLHLAAEHLDPWVDAVELGLERLIDDLSELRVVQHFEPDLLHQFSDALAVDGHRQRDLELVDDPVRELLRTLPRVLKAEIMPVLMAQRHCGKVMRSPCPWHSPCVVANAKDVSIK
jgi:hypothetical protein